MQILDNINRYRSNFWIKNKRPVEYFVVQVLVLTFLPAWLILFAMHLTKQWANVLNLLDGGSLFIYSAALLSAANYSMQGYSKKQAVSLISFVTQLSWILVVFSAAGFLVAVMPEYIYESAPIDIVTVRFTASIILAISLVISYYAVFYSSQDLNPDSSSRKRVKKLMEQIS